MTAIGFLAGMFVAQHQARTLGYSTEHVWEVGWRVIIAAMLGSRLFEVLFYNPFYYWQHPWEVLQPSAGGLSVYGGIIAGAVTIVWYLRSRKILSWQWLDVFALGAPLGIMFGRIGCFLIHDHPGTLTHFILGVRYPDGVRHDLGLEMAIVDGLIFLFLWFGRKRLQAYPGAIVLLFIGLKGLARFLLDFLRETSGPIVDARYAGLTPAQYIGIISVIGVVLVWQHLSNKQWT